MKDGGGRFLNGDPKPQVQDKEPSRPKAGPDKEPDEPPPLAVQILTLVSC